MRQRHSHDAPFYVNKTEAGNGYRFELVDMRDGSIHYECWTRSPIPPKSMQRIQGRKNTHAVLDGE